LFIIRGCAISKIINNVVECCYFFLKAFTRFDFTGDCQQTHVELCACTSDRERSARAGEGCTSGRQPINGNLSQTRVYMNTASYTQTVVAGNTETVISDEKLKSDLHGRAFLQ